MVIPGGSCKEHPVLSVGNDAKFSSLRDHESVEVGRVDGAIKGPFPHGQGGFRNVKGKVPGGLPDGDGFYKIPGTEGAVPHGTHASTLYAPREGMQCQSQTGRGVPA